MAGNRTDAELWLTGSARAAEWVRGREERRRAASGAWETPAILSLGTWLERVWAQFGSTRLLSTPQEHEVWRRIIAADAGADQAERIDLDATSRAAASAWRLVCDWELALDGAEWEQREETVRFRTWARRFAGACRKRGWVRAAGLTRAVAEAIRQGQIAAPAAVRLSGFDEFTPAQSRLIGALKAAGAAIDFSSPGTEPAAMPIVAAADAEQEWVLAARWARAQLTERERRSAGGVGDAGGEAGLIGVIVPDLASVRARVERVFQQTLEPHRAPGDAAAPRFQLSLGLPLTEWPVAAGALALLEWAASSDVLEIAAAGELACSPFVAGAVRERERRARWRRTWARQRLSFMSREGLTGAEARRQAPMLARALGRAERRRSRWPQKLSCRNWARAFVRLLDAAGWPGEAPLSSAEYQAAKAWSEVLESLCGLDLVTPRTNAGEALRRLRMLAAERIFQPRVDAPITGAAPVQVMGWLEAAGFEFEHLWMCGAHDGELPAAPAPNPFLPLTLQRERELPRSSAQREATFAEGLLNRVRRSAAALTVSFPTSEDTRPLRPSPLLGVRGELETNGVEPGAGGERIACEEIDDSHAPPASEDEARGGTSVLKDQSACPFRAFVHARLRATAERETPAGLGADSRGTLLHRALHAFWGALDGHEAVGKLSPIELDRAVYTAADQAVQQEPLLARRPGLAKLERERLTRLMRAWMELELARVPFRVLERESEREGTIGGLHLRLRLDRVDALEDGSRILIDYKSGEVGAKQWAPPRPEEPQLPTYLVTDEDAGSVAAIAFAQLRPGDMKFMLAGRTPAVSATKAISDWEDTVAKWRDELERLAGEFLAGEAAVDPTSRACERCDLKPLCRIYEIALLRPQAENEEDDGGE